MEYHVWCDESDTKGKHFSNFYGGAIVSSVDLDYVINTLKEKKASLNLYGEIKWSKMSHQYLSKYTEIISTFFQLVVQGKVKVRIMFRKTGNTPNNLSPDQINNKFFLLYYQFIKHGFGLNRGLPVHEKRTNLHISFDKLPDKKSKVVRFKNYIFKLNKIINEKNLFLPFDNISEVDSHDHEVLQCVDIITGAMSFKLNKKHLELMPGKKRRGKKTIAKEQLYKHINKEIRALYGYSFNVGASTGRRNGADSPWSMPYRHWLFVPKNNQES
ncbi:hypothetical protein AAU61_03115 [Desulfocarbo indianensis]|nr:hypothetical protein AAU61_03115 [Desulfocarbo indianensis]